jgi:hypothetical protein
VNSSVAALLLLEKTHLDLKIAVQKSVKLRIRRRPEELIESTNVDCFEMVRSLSRHETDESRSHLKNTLSSFFLGEDPSVMTPLAPCHGPFFIPATATLVALHLSLS